MKKDNEECYLTLSPKRLLSCSRSRKQELQRKARSVSHLVRDGLQLQNAGFIPHYIELPDMNGTGFHADLPAFHDRSNVTE